MAHLDLASLRNFVSTAAIVGALIFTALHVRPANNTRRDQAAVALIQTTQNSDWTQALNLLFTVTENATAEQIHAHGAAMEGALFEASVRLESVGYMVFCHTLSLQTVDDLIGGVAIGIYSRSRAWTEEYRRSTSNPRFNEWVEWLADRISERRGRSQRGPAHQQYRAWRER